jgi:hypothetical protein
MARRCATLAARCAMTRRMNSCDTLVSQRGGRTCGFPKLKGFALLQIFNLNQYVPAAFGSEFEMETRLTRLPADHLRLFARPLKFHVKPKLFGRRS